VKSLRGEVGPVGPDDRSTDGIEGNPSEVTGIVEGFEDRTTQEWLDIHDSPRAIAEG
jgi:hypothetical protein